MKKIIKVESRVDKFELIINIPDIWDENKIVIGCHGFDSSKDSEPMTMITDELEKVGIAYARFSWPYHAERRKDAGDFSVENCLEDLYKVENIIKEIYPKSKIGIYSTSFGSYLTLLRIKKEKHNFFSIVLRSPAINMDEIFKHCLIEENFSIFKEKGYTIRHRKTPMKVKYEFYEELKNNRIFDLGEYTEEMLIYHGTLDDTAPYIDTQKFTINNRNTKLVSLENESHKIGFEKLKEIHENIAEYIDRI